MNADLNLIEQTDQAPAAQISSADWVLSTPAEIEHEHNDRLRIASDDPATSQEAVDLVQTSAPIDAPALELVTDDRQEQPDAQTGYSARIGETPSTTQASDEQEQEAEARGEVFGDDGNNIITVKAGTQYINGAAGDDIINVEAARWVVGIGGAGNDQITGGNGVDDIIGGTGNDTLAGGADEDRFIFDSKAGIDTITDFKSGDDLLLFDETVFSEISPDQPRYQRLEEGQVAFGSQAADANDRLIYNKETGALYFDADGNGGGAAQQIAVLTNHAALTAADFGMTFIGAY